MADIDESIARWLEELGVQTSAVEVEELAAAYPALLAWMRMAEELARDDEAEDE